MTDSTPFMEQFLSIKAQYEDALLFFRMGDFYELFFDDAKIAAADLDIALTSRGSHEGKPIPMAGVPCHSADAYLARLIRKGRRVAICEQLESAAAAKARGGKQLVKRGVVRLVTPGTLTEDELLEPRQSNLLAALGVAAGGSETALALADISTGRFEIFACAPARLAEELAAAAPGEIIAAEMTLSHSRLAPLLEQSGAPIVSRPDIKARPGAGAEAMKKLFAVSTLEGFGEFTSSELSAASLLLDYLLLAQSGGTLRLDSPLRRHSSKYMAIDPATRAGLEIERTMQGKRTGSLLAAIDRCLTAPGGRVLAARLNSPLTDPEAINDRQDAVAFFHAETEIRQQIRSELKGMPDPQRARMRLRLGRGGPRDLAALAAGLRRGERIAARIAKAPPEVERAAMALNLSAMPALERLSESLSRALDSDLPLRVSEGGFIAAGFDPGLDEARSLRAGARGKLAELEAHYSRITGVSGLRIKHNNMLGYFIETATKNAATLTREPHDKTFIHRQSLASSIRFSTARLTELQTKIDRAASVAQAREQALFDEFVEKIEELSNLLASFMTALAEIDVAAALAEWADEHNATRPMIDNSRVLQIKAGRHPVVEASRRAEGNGFVANDCHLDADGAETARLLLVTGPNMAGKSTWLRQNALIAILAQAGSFVPAQQARIGIIDRVFSRVGAADDLARGRSTFMVEMIETAAILNQAGPRALVILDEVGRGTATYDGMAIAWAVTEYLHEINNCRTLFATHYHELTALAMELKMADNVSFKAREWKGRLVFLYEMRPGPTDKSYGVQAARLAGLPPAALERAEQILLRLEKEGKYGNKLAGLPLFAEAPEPPPEPSDAALSKILNDTDANSLTPREALDLVYRLKEAAAENTASQPTGIILAISPGNSK